MGLGTTAFVTRSFARSMWSNLTTSRYRVAGLLSSARTKNEENYLAQELPGPSLVPTTSKTAHGSARCSPPPAPPPVTEQGLSPLFEDQFLASHFIGFEKS